MPSSVYYLLIIWKSCTQKTIDLRRLVWRNPKIILLLHAVLSNKTLVEITNFLLSQQHDIFERLKSITSNVFAVGYAFEFTMDQDLFNIAIYCRHE